MPKYFEPITDVFKSNKGARNSNEMIPRLLHQHRLPVDDEIETFIQLIRQRFSNRQLSNDHELLNTEALNLSGFLSAEKIYIYIYAVVAIFNSILTNLSAYVYSSSDFLHVCPILRKHATKTWLISVTDCWSPAVVFQINNSFHTFIILSMHPSCIITKHA